uniref:Major sperm protein n=1 Tax=Meloidogyne javanica TaxID=6303 RepID=A0A915LUE0_MELJA
IRNPLPYNVVMRVLSTDPEKIHIWPYNAIIPAGGAMDIGINFEAISKFRKERILVKIINLPHNFLDLTIPQIKLAESDTYP